MDRQQLISEIENLPIEERTSIIDELLQSLNTPDPEIEEAWIEEAERRLDEIESGKVETIPGEQVISSIRERLSK